MILLKWQEKTFLGDSKQKQSLVAVYFTLLLIHSESEKNIKNDLVLRGRAICIDIQGKYDTLTASLQEMQNEAAQG